MSFLRLRIVKKIASKERPTNKIQVNCISHTATSEKQAVPTGMDKVNNRPKKLLVRARTSGARFFMSMALIFGETLPDTYRVEKRNSKPSTT